MTSKLQNLLILLGMLVLLGIGYYLLVLSADSDLKNNAINNRAAADTAIFLKKLTSLKKIELDGKIFSDPRFVTLVDNTVPIAPPLQGRTNPFEPTN